jgi:tRNA dimethylallyltransferase
MRMTFILGPTACGKSELAMLLARKENAAIFAMDAMQVYRGADIGTSKPTHQEQKEIPHGGIDLADIGQPFSVADYLREAEKFLSQCRAQEKPVLIVGGTGLYFRALTQGLCEAPAAPKELKAELAALPLSELQKRLRKADPAICASLDMQNPRRVQRALEVVETTGVSLRVWQQKNTPPLVPIVAAASGRRNDFTGNLHSKNRRSETAATTAIQHDVKAYFISRSKPDLDARIAARVDAMLGSGWLAETRALVARHGLEAMRRFPAIGYPQLAALETDSVPETTREAIIIATRQYAKRQLTWFARERNLIQVMANRNDSAASLLRSLGDFTP